MVGAREFINIGVETLHEIIYSIWETIDNGGKFQYQINRDLPIVKKLEESLDEQALGYLDSFIKTIEDVFPYGDVYYRLAKDENAVDQTGMDFEEVYKVAVNMVLAYKEMGGDINTFLDSMDKIDYFVKYPDVVKKLGKTIKMTKEQEQVIAQVQLQIKPDEMVDEDKIKNLVNFFRTINPLTDEEAKEAIAELQSKLAVKIDRGAYEKDKNHVSWYYAANPN